MADVRPFKGIRYNPARIRDLSLVITQPYDKISPEMRRAYYRKHPESFVRLILPDSRDPYNDSKTTLEKWLSDGTLVRDDGPAFYVIHQEFDVSGIRKLRKGFIGVVRVEEFEKGAILPHERTLSKPKADRLNMVRATEKDYEQIFLLYPDPEGDVDEILAPEGRPRMEATDDYGVKERVWVVTDPKKVAAARKALAGKVMLIADGHHRYETALNYRKEMEAAGPVPDDAALRFKTTAFVNINDPGLVILPTHRLLHGLPALDWNGVRRGLERWFHVYRVSDELLAREVASSFWLTEHVFGLYAGKGRSWVLRLTDKTAMRLLLPDRSDAYRGLDAAILHTLVIDQVFGVPPDKVEDHVAYERKADAALAGVDSSAFQAALIMNPTRAEQVSKVAGRGERMPQKSTDFYPKLVSGLVFFDVAENERVPA
jgi:uncharacterized protein (DUF1015 family)